MSIRAALLVVAAAAATLAAATGAALFTCDFETDPVATGWTPGNAAAPGVSKAWLSSGGRSGKHALQVSGVGWQSPKFNAQPGQFYRVAFTAKTDKRGAMVAMLASDSNATVLPASNYTGVYTSDDWLDTQVFVLAPDATARACIEFSAPADAKLIVDDVAVAPVGREEVLEWMDAMSQVIPPFGTDVIEPDPCLDRIVAKMKAGKGIRCVIFGGSAANDLAHSHFQLLVEGVFPGAKCAVIQAICGGTAPDYSMREDRLRQLVGNRSPDLVILGNVSGTDVKGVRDLVRQIRSVCAAEVLVTTLPTLAPTGDKASTKPQDDKAFRKALVEAGKDDKFAVFDLGDAFDRYIAQSAEPLDWYKRDAYHFNERGRQVMARLMENFFRAQSK